MKNFIIAAICLGLTLASNAPAKDKKHHQATENTTTYQGATLRFPIGTGGIFSIGPFPIIFPPLVVLVDAQDTVPAQSTRSTLSVLSPK
jgi:uncharacterized membrane protein